jgi:hypothetical protein
LTGYRVVQVNPYLKKISKRRRFNKKKTKVNRFLTGFCQVNLPGHDLSYCFFNPAWFQPRVGWVPGRSAGPGFKAMVWFKKILN